MLAQAEMSAVFAPREKITLGTRERVPADELLSRRESLRCHRDESSCETGMKRGKPRKRETQIW